MLDRAITFFYLTYVKEHVATSKSMYDLQYTIDGSNIITSTGDAFKQFAEDNDAPDLHLKVLGKPIWQFLYTDEVNSVYDKLFQTVRKSQKSVSMTFRCDSKDTLRFMSIHIEPTDADALRISTKTVRTIPRARILASEILYQGVKDGMPMCSQCNKIYIKNLKDWIEIDAALEGGVITDRLSVTFALCRSCLSTFQSTIDELMGA